MSYLLRVLLSHFPVTFFLLLSSFFRLYIFAVCGYMDGRCQHMVLP